MASIVEAFNAEKAASAATATAVAEAENKADKQPSDPPSPKKAKLDGEELDNREGEEVAKDESERF